MEHNKDLLIKKIVSYQIEQRVQFVRLNQACVNVLVDVLEQDRELFMERQHKFIKDVEEYKDDDVLYKKVINTLNKEVGQYFTAIETILNEFTNSLRKITEK